MNGGKITNIYIQTRPELFWILWGKLKQSIYMKRDENKLLPKTTFFPVFIILHISYKLNLFCLLLLQYIINILLVKGPQVLAFTIYLFLLLFSQVLCDHCQKKVIKICQSMYCIIWIFIVIFLIINPTFFILMNLNE